LSRPNLRGFDDFSSNDGASEIRTRIGADDFGVSVVGFFTGLDGSAL